ncbi:MAG: hypothetical protein L7H18_04610 [Candidatus Nealsonbacteria bacterium DGGOD1a]|jgi:hypothetical protein|nr:MAG: hypothetical protein L7H18_04610 [Candidatus Nealsonbacteria bacterium DGGOD1a]
MNNRLVLSVVGGILFLFVVVFGYWYVAKRDSSRSYTETISSLKGMESYVPIAFPIHTAVDAGRFAIGFAEVRAELVRAEEEAKYPGWRITTFRKEEGVWFVDIESQGKILPSYSCELTVVRSGDVEYVKRCSYNK